MKTLIFAAVTSATLAGSAGGALAQYGDVVPIRPNYRGEPSCPSNYVIRGNACVSIYAGRGGYEGGYRRDYYDRPRRYRGDYDGGGRGAVQPRLNYRGEWQCPSNYVIRGGLCVSLY
jgi:hypothetical protein